MASTRTDAPWIRPGSAWRWIGGLVGVWVAVSLIGYLALDASSRRLCEAARERWRASGAPTTLEALGTGAARDGSPAEAWLAGVSGDGPHEFELVVGRRLPLLGALNPTLAAVRSFRADALDAGLVADEVCDELRVGFEGRDEALARLLARPFEDPLEALRWRDCLAHALRVRWKLDEDPLDHELGACSIAPLDAGELLRQMEERDWPRPEIRADRVSTAVARLSAQARAEALAGRSQECLAALEASFCATAIVADLPWVEGYLMWESCAVDALGALTECLSLLPPEADPGRLSAALDALEPEARLVRALEGERVLCDRLYERLGHGRSTGMSDLDEGAGLASYLVRPLANRDRARFHDEFERLLAEARQPLFPPGTANLPTESRDWQVLGPGLIEPALRAVELRGNVAAREALCRTAMVAWREGVVAGQAACTTYLDPFDGKPLRSRVEPDGSLTLWSVGPNRSDDGGSTSPVSAGTPSADIVVRVLAR